MNLTDITGQITALAGTFNLWLVLAIFLMLAVGEFGIFVPYAMETMWILVGYYTFIGTISIFDLIVLMLVAMSGRETGGHGPLPYRRVGQGADNEAIPQSFWFSSIHRITGR